MWATFKLLNSYFWKTIYGPIISFVLPVLLLAILGNVMRVQYVYPGIVALSIMLVGIISLPLAIMELKSSSLFKYIGASPIDIKRFSIVAISYYILISWITVLIILVATIAIYHNQVLSPSGFKYGILGGIFYTFRGIGSFLFSVILHLILVITIGLAIATFSKTPQQALTIAITMVFPSMFLSGMIISVDIIAHSHAMQWISRFVPFRYTTGNIVVASTPYDQLGDLFSLLSIEEKKFIFSGVDDNGFISAEEVINDKDVKINIKSTNDLLQVIKANGGNYKNLNFIKDKTLYEIVFIKVQPGALSKSNNNVFDWLHPWVVRRSPKIEQVKQAMTKYFQGEDGQGGDVTRFIDVWNEVQNKNFTWLDIFLKQNNVLYTIPDRVLNTLIPISISAISLFYVHKKFTWSSR